MRFFWRYIFPAIMGLIIYTTIRLVNDLTANMKFWERPWHTTFIELSFTIATSYIVQFMVDYYIRKFNAEKSKPFTTKRILKEYGTIYLWLFIIVNVVDMPMTALTDDGLGLNDFVIAHIIPGLYILLYFSIRRGNHYLAEYLNQQLRIEKIEKDQLQTELKFLKAQYHPHFLFNALNTIYFQMDENVADAKKSVEKFSELLRYQLYDQQQTVPARQEIEYLRTFIDLQKVRSSDKLQLKVAIDESINGQHIYPLLFLPLVENAFKYVGGDYKINIEAKQEEEAIRFHVFNSTPLAAPATKPGGIGLDNLNRRLSLLYPGKHSLKTIKLDKGYDAELILNLNGTAQ